MNKCKINWLMLWEFASQSKDIATAVYSCDWTIVTPRERRSLMLIIISSQKGIMFSYHGIFALSLNTFTWVSKWNIYFMYIMDVYYVFYLILATLELLHSCCLSNKNKIILASVKLWMPSTLSVLRFMRYKNDCDNYFCFQLR